VLDQLLVARLLVCAARKRTESVGAHAIAPKRPQVSGQVAA